MNSSPCPRIVLFGEVLFDVFSDGREVLGGATFNVAWNLAGLGLDPLFISRIGEDDLGERILAALGEGGLDVSGIQRDPVLPTGIVEVTLEASGHRFEILRHRAYDAIEAAPALAAMRAAGEPILYQGTLVTREATSRSSLRDLRQLPHAGIFVDLNLRKDCYSDETVLEAVRGARWLKLNDDEIVELGRLLEIPVDSLVEGAGRFRERLDLEGLLLTRGEHGALYVTADSPPREVAAGEVGELLDTVGAGDAFSAVFLAGHGLGWPVETTLERAAAFASSICGLRGAITLERSFYRGWRERWGA